MKRGQKDTFLAVCLFRSAVVLFLWPLQRSARKFVINCEVAEGGLGRESH
jgi:hypothetical protein